MDEAAVEEIEVVSSLARSCLGLIGAERPSMKEVTSELEGLVRRLADHTWVENREETNYLLADHPPSFNSEINGIESLQSVLLSLEIGR